MKGCVVLQLKLKPGREAEFLKAHEVIQPQMKKMKGFICDRICQSSTDPLAWAIISEWETLEDFLTWEHAPEHPVMVQPLLECRDSSVGFMYVIRVATNR